MIQYSFRMLDLINVPIRQAKKYSYFIIIQKVLDGIIPSLQVFIMARFIDTAIEITQNNATPRELIVPFILLIFTISYSWFSNEILIFAETKLVHKLRETLQIDITDKCSRLKYKYVENDDSQNLISRVLKESENEFKNGFRNILNLCTLTIRAFGIVAIIMFKVWWCGIIIFIFNIPLVYLSIKNGKVTYKAAKDVTYNMRKYEYLSEILVGRDTAAERNIFGYTDYINGMWYEQYEISRKKQIKAFLSYFSKIKIY
jgi:ATP-binding cassette subfamily B protein